jgi:uncharacterized membrane protein YfcA
MITSQIALALLSGGAVGLSLGLIGGGGSVLAVPLLVYAVGVPSPHVAIGTSAVAVTINALMSLLGHARSNNVRWPCAVVFALFGMAGVALGAHVGKSVDGQKLLAAFGALMIVIAALMLRPKRTGDDTAVHLDGDSAARLLPRLGLVGITVGALSGFFGIGGGFVIVPGLVTATAMPLVNAVGSSLVSVAVFGATTAVSYAASGLVDWTLAALFVGGGTLGGLAGIRLAQRLSGGRRHLNYVFSAIVALTGVYVVMRGIVALL